MLHLCFSIYHDLVICQLFSKSHTCCVNVWVCRPAEESSSVQSVWLQECEIMTRTRLKAAVVIPTEMCPLEHLLIKTQCGVWHWISCSKQQYELGGHMTHTVQVVTIWWRKLWLWQVFALVWMTFDTTGSSMFSSHNRITQYLTTKASTAACVHRVPESLEAPTTSSNINCFCPLCTTFFLFKSYYYHNPSYYIYFCCLTSCLLFISLCGSWRGRFCLQGASVIARFYFQVAYTHIYCIWVYCPCWIFYYDRPRSFSCGRGACSFIYMQIQLHHVIFCLGYKHESGGINLLFQL